MSRWVLPVPESPIKHNGCPALTQAQVANCPMTAGLMAGLASKENSSNRFGRGKPASRMRRSARRRARSSHSAITSSDKKPQI